MTRKAAQSTANQFLRQARLERGWTQKNVADRIGAPLDLNVTRWERGTARPSAYYVQRLCELFGKSPGELGLLPKHPQEAATSHQQDPPPAPEPQRLWNVPFRRNPFFTGRVELLQELHNQLQKEQRSALTQTPALTGLGGIGKTQLAVEYAYRYSEDYHAVFWTRAESRETLAADFAGLAQLLRLPVRDDRDQPLIVAAVKRWLGQHEGWLLILDNADDLPLVVDFLPGEGQGRILLTTRAQATGDIARSILVEQMESSEGTRLLLRRAKLLDFDAPLDAIPAETLALAQAIVKVLDGLPLALDQAGAYIEETGCSLSDYLALYERHRSTLLNRPGLATSYPYTVASTWSLSFQEVEQANPVATEILRLCAFLDADAIPEEILSVGMATPNSPPPAVTVDPLFLNEAIQVLRRFSLVKRDREKKLLAVHRLVQAVLRDAMDEETQRQWAERCVRAVNRAFPEGEYENLLRRQQYIPHVLSCVKHVERWGLASPEAAQLLSKAGDYLRESAQYEQAEPLLQRALAICERVLGPEHPDTAQSLNQLALLYHAQGKYAQAESLLQRAIAIGQETGASKERWFVETINNLAMAYHAQGKYALAEPLYQQSLAANEELLGPEHPVVGISTNDLAYFYKTLGKYSLAEPLYRRALAIQEQALGVNHPDVALILNNLAVLYQVQGKYALAEPLYQRAITIREQTLGADHPDLAQTLNNLGTLYRDQQKNNEAQPLLERALAIREHSLGTEHPVVIISLISLANLYRDQERYEEAKALYQRALRMCEQTLAPLHPDLATTLTNLAKLYTKQSRYAQAEPLHQQALAIREQTLGPDHPYTATSLHHLAWLYQEQGKHEQAEPLYQRALAIRERLLGHEHADTVTTRHNLARLYQDQGKYEQAELLL